MAKATEVRGSKLGLRFLYLPVTGPADLMGAFEKAAGAGIETLLVIDDGTITKQRHEIFSLASSRRLPVVSIYKHFAKAGGLIAYGPNLDIFYRHAAYYVDKILRGSAPSDLPVEQPSKFDFLINLKAANALGLTIPQS